MNIIYSGGYEPVASVPHPAPPPRNPSGNTMTDTPDQITLALMAGAEQARAIAQLSDTVAQQAQLIAELSAELAELRDATPASPETGTLDS